MDNPQTIFGASICLASTILAIVLMTLSAARQIRSVRAEVKTVRSRAVTNISIESLEKFGKQAGKNYNEHLVRLRQNLASYFNEGELRTLCFDLEVDYDDLPGNGKADKARELVDYLRHRDRISELERRCAELRPNVRWRRSSTTRILSMDKTGDEL